MPDVQRLIDEIRFQLDAEVFEFSPAMKQLAVDYAEICRHVNGRLRRCEDFLKQGLRSEAIHAAEAEPNLLDLVAAIDISERARWDGMVRLFDLPRAEPLLVEVAEQLNAAYALQQPLEALLERHRLLALARAPLVDRLKVLRELAALDEMSPVWNDDVRAFELARVSEIEAAAADAEEQADFGWLERLFEELSDGDWHGTPAASIVERIRRMAEQAIRQSAPSEPAGLRNALNAAATTGDMPRCRALRRRWHELGILSPPVGRNGQNDGRGPGVAWLAREDAKDARELRIRRTVAVLERKLDADADVDELQEAAESVRQIAGELPEPVATRFHDRVNSLEGAVRSRDKLFIYSAVACLLLAVSVAGVVLLWG